MKKSVSLFVVLSIVISLFVTTPIAANAVTGTDIVNDLINNYVGKYQYVINTHGPNTFDCTGLVYYVYKKYGITLPYTTKNVNWKQYGTVIYDTSKLKSGDILLFGSSENDLNHAGIYDANGGYIIHALNSNYDITRQPTLYTWMNNSSWNSQGSNQFQYAVRVLNDAHTHSFWVENEAVHPHRQYRRCSCGYTEYTGNTGYYSTCSTCTTPGKPSFVDVKSLYGTNKGVYVDWTATANTTNYNIVFEKKNDSGSYQTDMIVTWATVRNYHDLEVGDYRMYIQSINQNVTLSNGSHPSTNSEYHYFKVTDEPASYEVKYEKVLIGDGEEILMACLDIVCENVTSLGVTFHYRNKQIRGEYINLDDETVNVYADSGEMSIVGGKISENIYRYKWFLNKPGEYKFRISCSNVNGESGYRGHDLYYVLNEGMCGDNVSYTYAENKLNIIGIGEMYDFGVTVSSKLPELPWYRYSGAIKNVKIDDRVTRIGENAFAYAGISQIDLPKELKSIGNDAFKDCGNLSSIEVPDSVTTIGEEAFYSCRRLGKIVLPNSISSIGCGAFDNCIKLSNISLPNRITVINENTFWGCKSLPSIYLPESVVSIKESAFYGCGSLASINVANSVTDIGNYAFGECFSLKDVFYSGTRAEWNQIQIGEGNECLTNATIHCIDDIAVTDVSLDKTFVSLGLEETTTLNATVLPYNATNKKVSWTSSNEGVAIVDENGVVTAVGVGKATITATTEDGGFSARCEVLVDKPITSTTYKELTSTYKFYIECEKELNNELLAVACYDEDGRTIALEQIECDGDTSYTASVPKDTNIKYAKIFVWSDYDALKPMSYVETVNVN